MYAFDEVNILIQVPRQGTGSRHGYLPAAIPQHTFDERQPLRLRELIHLARQAVSEQSVDAGVQIKVRQGFQPPLVNFIGVGKGGNHHGPEALR